MATYTTTELLASVKQRAQLPDQQETWTDEAILRTASEELRSYLTPFVLRHREDFFVTYQDQVLSSVRKYRLPARAVGKIKDITVVDGSGETSLLRVNQDELRQDAGFYFSGSSHIILTTNAPTTGTLRIHFQALPNTLVLLPLATVTNDGSGFGDWTVDLAAWPAAVTTNTKLDIIKAEPNFESTVLDQKMAAVNNGLLSLSNHNAEIVTGDIICYADESPYPQIPIALFPLLSQLTVVKILESLDDPLLDKALRDLARMLEMAPALISPRIDGEAKVISSEDLFTGGR